MLATSMRWLKSLRTPSTSWLHVCTAQNRQASLKLSILPNKNSICRYATLGAYCGIICPDRSTSFHVNPRSSCVVPITPAAASVDAEGSLW